MVQYKVGLDDGRICLVLFWLGLAQDSFLKAGNLRHVGLILLLEPGGGALSIVWASRTLLQSLCILLVQDYDLTELVLEAAQVVRARLALGEVGRALGGSEPQLSGGRQRALSLGHALLFTLQACA